MTKSMNRRLSQTSLKNTNHKARDLRMESLEERQLLSVSPASAASDDVDYACIAPAEMVPMESAPVVEMNLTDEVPTLDAPVALGADLPADGNIYGYYFELGDGGSVTYEGTKITVSGIVTISLDDNPDTTEQSVTITNSGALTVSAPLASGSTVTLVEGGTLTNNTSSSVTTNFGGYTFTLANGATFEITGGNSVSVSGSVTVTDDTSTEDASISINCASGNLTVNTTLAGTSYVDLASGSALSVASGKTVPTVNSNGGAISGDGTITTLDLTSGTTTVSGGNVGSTTGSGDISVTGGSITSATSTGAVSVNGGSIDTVSNSTNITLESGSIYLVELSGGATTTINGAGQITEVQSSGNSTISGGGKIGTLTLTDGTTTTVSGTTIDATSAGTGNLTVTGGKVTNSYTSGEIQVTGGEITNVTNSKKIALGSDGTIGTVTLVSGTDADPAVTTINGSGKIGEVISNGNSDIAGSGNIGTLTLSSGTTDVSGATVDQTTGNGALEVSGGTVTAANGSGAVTISAGEIGSVTGASSVNCSGTGTITGAVSSTGLVTISAGSIGSVTSATGVKCSGSGTITTVTITGKTEVSTNGHIDSVTGTGATEITGGSIGSVTNTSTTNGVVSSGGTIGTVNIAGTTTVKAENESQGHIDYVTGSGPVVISNGTIGEVSGNGAITASGGTITTASGNGNITISGGTITTASGTGTINVSGGTVGTASGGGNITISNGEVTNVTGNSKISLSNTGEIGTVSGDGDIDISGGTITTVSGDGTITVDGGTISQITADADGPVIINGTANADTIAVGQTITVGTTSVTFDTGATADVTINAGGGDDLVNVTAKPTSGALTVNGGDGNDVLIGGGQAVTLNGEGGGDLIIAGTYSGNSATLQSNWDGDVATALTWAQNGALSDSNVGAASADAVVDGGATGEGNALYYKGEGLTHSNFDLELTSTSTVIVVTAAKETEVSAATITMTEAYAAINAGAGGYTLGFSHAAYTVDSATPQYTKTGADNKLTIDGSQLYNSDGTTVSGSGPVTATVQGGMTISANTNVEIVGLNWTYGSGSGVGIENNGTLTLSGGAKVSGFKSYGILNQSAGTLTITSAEIASNTSHGIRNEGGLMKISGTGTGEDSSIKIHNNGGDGIRNTADLSAAGYELSGVYIYSNSSYGIENIGSSNAKLNITSATIKKNSYGIKNQGGGTVNLNGSAAGAISISENNYSGIDNESSTINVTNATIGQNGSYGIYNNGGEVTIGTPSTGVASEVLIVNNQNGVGNGGVGKVEIYNATISGNTVDGITNGLSNTSDSYTELILNGNKADAILIGEVKDGETVLYNGNTKSGIDNSAQGKVIISKATINANKDIGIHNEGLLEIGTSTGGDAANVVISYNTNYGIENTSAGVVDGEGAITTPGLQVYNATINNNTADGIYNHSGGSVTVGVEGRTSADVQIHRNDHDGIDNSGSGSTLVVHNAEIFKTRGSYSGINNHDGATANIYGATANAIYIHENYGYGIRAGEGTVNIGVEGTGKAANVVVYKNGKDGIYMPVSGAIVTVYNAKISENEEFGIDSKDTSTLNLLGNSSEDLDIYKNGYSGVNNQGGGTVTVTKATIDSNGTRTTTETAADGTTSNKNGGDGINNRKGTLIIGTYNETTRKAGAASDVKITNNTRYGIQNGGDSDSCKLTIYNATIGGENNGNLNGGIYSTKGEVTIGVENRESATTDVVISYNKADDNQHNHQIKGNGIYNSQGTLTINNADISYNANNGIQSSGNLYVKKATISHNTKDGIYDFNEGTAKRTVEIGTQGSGEAGDVVITENGQDGIGNREYNSELTIYNATITKNGRHGIDNGEDDTHQGIGFTHIYGNTVDAVMIAENTGNGIYNSSEDELDILKATIKDNEQCGIMNKHGKVVIGTSEAVIDDVDEETGEAIKRVGKAEDVVISGNRGDGIENYYNELTIYNVTIKDQKFVDEGIRSSYGINNKSGFVNLYGNTSADILISGNYSGGIQNMDGEHTSSGAEIQGTLVITKATITQNGNSGYTGTENWGHGIYNRDGHVTLGTADGNTDDVKITANVKDGIHNDPKTASHLASDLKIIKAVISGNGNHGIDNEGTLMLEGTGTGANSSIQITGNTGDGIYNEADLRNIQQKGVYIYNNTRNGIENVVTTRSSGYLHITQATIDNNTLDGIYNSGTVKVGIGGETGSATDVMITNNKSDGIENISNDTIEVYDATISGNTDYGINNSGTAKIYGIGAGAESTVQIKTNPTGIYNTGTLLVSGANITQNTNYGINNAGGTATLEGSGAGDSSTVQVTNQPTGILNSATLDITGATVSGNTNIGIDNENGTAKLRGSGEGTSSTVQVTGQGTKQPIGIYNTGADSSLEISGAYITTNTTNGIGIQNHGGNATLEGATANKVQITSSKTGVLNEYVSDTQKGNLTITGAKIFENTNYGIDNQGGIVSINGESVDKVLVNNNDAGGIRNANTTSPASTGTLSVSGATIQFNGDENTSTDDGDGIYNEGVATIGEGATVLIDRNQGDGIENSGADADLTVKKATISANGKNANAYDYGIYNHQGGTALLDGDSAAAIVIRDNGRSDDDALSGGVYNGTGSEFTIHKATVTANHHHGIENDGTMVIGTDADGHGKDEVLITSNKGDGIENKGSGADLTVYNATISGNANSVVDGYYDYGIDNRDGGKVLLDGNSAEAIYIYNNGRNDTEDKSGGIYNGANSEFTIVKATVTENHHHGIENDGTMVIGTQGSDHGKDEVLITLNKGDGIENKGSGADLTVYNATITENANSSGADGYYDYGIDNHDGGKVLLDGNTGWVSDTDPGAIYIAKNGWDDSDDPENPTSNLSGGIYNGSGSDFTIIKATVTENHHHGIENLGTMTLGTKNAEGSTTVGAATDVQITKNKGNGIDNGIANNVKATLRIYNANISQNDVGSHTESNININNGIRNDGTVVIGVQGSTDAGAVTINENRGNGILNRIGGDVTVYNATIDSNTNDIHFLDDPNNNGIRNDSGAKLKLKGSLDSNGNESIRLTNNGEDGLFNAADLSAAGYEVEHIYAAGNGSEGVEQNRIKSSDETPYMTILSGTIYYNGYGSTSDKYGFGIHVKRGTMNLKGADVSSINIYENYQSGIRVANDSVLNVEKATINQNGINENGDGIHASGTSQVTIGINGHAASEVLITNNKRSGIQVADTNTKLTVYNAKISGNNGTRTDVPHHGINNKGQTKLLGTGSGEDATIQILENGQHGIYNNYIIDQAQGLYIEGNGLRGIKNEKTFKQTGAIDVVNNIGGGIDNTGGSATYTQNADTTLNVLNNKGAKDADENYLGVNDDGAGIKNTGTLTLNGTTNITGNVGLGNGGGLYQGGKNGGNSGLTNGLNADLTIQSNTAENGGGVYVAEYTLLKNGSADSSTGKGTISDNTATANGGGIYVAAGKTLQTKSGDSGNVTYNTAKQDGGGIYNAGNLKFYDSVTIDHNTAEGNGGGIYQGGTLTNGLDTKLTVTNNTAGSGGGVYVAAATTLKNGSTNTITGNTATNGGGIYVEAGKTLTFETSNITANTGTNGGGMYLAGTLVNSGGSAQLTFENNNLAGTEARMDNGGGLYIASTGSYGATGKFVLNRQEDFHFVNNGHYTAPAEGAEVTDATRGGAIYNAGTLEVANTNYGFGVTVTGDPNGVKTMTPNNEINTGIGAAVYNAGTFTNASEYKAFHAGGIDNDGTVDTSTHKTYSLYVTGQKGESAFASSGTTTLSNAKIYGNATGGLRVEDGVTTLTQGTEIGSGAFILATKSYKNYSEGFGANTGYGVKVTGGSLQSTEAQTYAQYTNKRKNTEFAGAARYEDYQVADAVQISGNTSTAIIVEGTGKVFLNDMRAESNGAAGLNAAETAGGYITNALIEGTIARGGVTLVNTTIPKVTETGTTNNIAGENEAGDRFVVDELGNIYTLNSDFDAIDTGTNANAVYHFADDTTRAISHDLGGHDRIINGVVDLGAFECPISWITDSLYIDDIKYAVEHCAPVAFGGKVKFDISCNGHVFIWDDDYRDFDDQDNSVHHVDPTEIYVDKDTILDARYEDTSGNYYWMDIVMDFGDLSVGFTQYYSNTTFNVYGLTVVATNGKNSKNGSAFFLPELRKGGSVVNLYGVSCYDCSGVYGGAIYAQTNGVVNIYANTTADGYVTGKTVEGVTGNENTYRACVFEGNTATYGGAIYSNNKRTSTVIGGVEYTTGLNIIGVDLQGKTYVSTGREANSTVTKYSTLQYDETTDERTDGTDAVRQYSAQFIDNQASRRGGAINLVGNAAVEGASFIDNYTGYGNSPIGGGALYIDGSADMTLKNADFIENSSKVDAGAIMVRGKLTSDGNLVFAGNTAPYLGTVTSGTRDGGAIYCYGGTMTLRDDAQTTARELYKDGAAKLNTVGGRGSEFLNNEANFGGAVHVQSGTVNFTNALFQRNKASVGGALYNETTSANVTVGTGSEFLQNYASAFAGAVYNNAGSFTSAATYKNNWATNEGALYSRYEEGIDLSKVTANYATGVAPGLYYNYWMDSYDGQEAAQKTGKKLPVEVSYFGTAGLETKTKESLEPAAQGLLGVTNSPNSTLSLGSMSEWENIYAVVTLKEEVGAGDTMVQELDIDPNVFQVGALTVAEGWEGQVSVTDDAKVLLTLKATADSANIGENIASLEVLTPEEGLAEDAELMGTEVKKAECYDLVKDGRIDIQDLVVFAQSFGTDSTVADFNGDNRVDIADLVQFARNFGQKKAERSTVTLAAAAAPEATPVAEPAAIVAEPVAAPAFIPAQSVKLETVEAKEEPSAVALAATAPVETQAVKARDSIFASDEEEDEDWLEDICSDLEQDAQTQLIDDLFGKN